MKFYTVFFKGFCLLTFWEHMFQEKFLKAAWVILCHILCLITASYLGNFWGVVPPENPWKKHVKGNILRKL